MPLLHKYTPAFSVPYPLTHYGMALRDYFAGQALVGYMAWAGAAHQDMDEHELAKFSGMVADAMLAERKAANEAVGNESEATGE